MDVSHSVVSDSLQPHGLHPTRLLCPWDSPDKNTGVGCHAFLQGVFLTNSITLLSLHFFKSVETNYTQNSSLVNSHQTGPLKCTQKSQQKKSRHQLLHSKLYQDLGMLSHFSLVQLFTTLWTVAHQASLSMGFSRQEYWSG